MSDKPASPPKLGNIFANALASTPRYVDAGVAAGMHNSMACSHCGAGREHAVAGAEKRGSDSLVCRYCGTALTHGGRR